MKLNEYRIKHQLSVIKLAEKLGISRQHVYDMESGKAKPSVRMAAWIEEKLNSEVTACELLGIKKH